MRCALFDLKPLTREAKAAAALMHRGYRTEQDDDAVEEELMGAQK